MKIVSMFERDPHPVDIHLLWSAFQKKAVASIVNKIFLGSASLRKSIISVSLENRSIDFFYV